MTEVSLTISGIQEAQAANNRSIAALKPSGALGDAVRAITAGAHRYAVSIAHVDTGAMRAAQHQEVRGLRGTVFTDPGAVNPRGGRPSIYVEFEEARGGRHALYTRAVAEEAPKLIAKALDKIGKAATK